MINEVVEGLEQVAVHLDDMVVLDSDPVPHVKTIPALVERLRKRNCKLSPSKARLGPTDADLFSHCISHAGERLNAHKGVSLAKMPMPRNIEYVRALMGGSGYYRKCVRGVLKRTRPVTTSLRGQVRLHAIDSDHRARDLN